MFEGFIFGLLIGGGCSAFMFALIAERQCIEDFDNKRRLKDTADKALEEMKEQRELRINAEVRLVNAEGIIKYQRDRLYALAHREEIREVCDE